MADIAPRSLEAWLRRARPLRRAIASIAVAVVVLLIGLNTGPSCRADAPEMLVAGGETMGSTYSIKIFDPPPTLAEDWRLLVDRELRLINDQMSTYIDSSEVSRFNASGSLDWFPVSDDLALVVAKAQEISALSGGAFDITLMPVVKAWSFGPGKKRNVPPSEEELQTLREQVGYEQLEWRDDPPALRKRIPGLSIDLNAIAPGHGADRLVKLLQGMGAKNLFVEVGGEIRVTGDKGGDPWMVGIQQPDVTGQAVAVAYPLRDRSIATSGDYRSYFEFEGRRYSHTIDPRTMKPVTHALASVTVLADDCMTADALATTLSVLGDEQGLEFARRQGLDTLMMVRKDDGTMSNFATGEFEGVLETTSAESPGAAGDPASLQDKSAGSQPSFWPVAIAGMVAFGLVVAAMAVGVMFGRRSISGSCGGLANSRDADGNVSCSLCSNPDNACRELRERMQPQAAEKEPKG
ncbi:MAG: FAD:protein FMN transferase [Planctomycetaceae bacterium]